MDGHGIETMICVGWRPIYPSRNDILTDKTARQILAHNSYGAARSCWKKGYRKK
ncbi:hypothetical protein B488_07680 [Liberibacter crescens BT-1]|uniref:Uncharacterized protein n=1 Tax=Liberibacter crescens (strain BT-1) TaxID=1215343 RepID=L0EV80_LIBCB|nr:hypothetical protein [Liberibacter crescens]AGA64760.1 hypothetical protein B488_07680 [Liberibacter crescens BT-1]